MGAPGAGKTTTLLELTQSLIERAEQDITQPIPVVLKLSSWAVKKPKLKDWLIQELNLHYQARKYVKVWIENQKLLLLLDGLDEVNEKDRDDCVIAINQFCQAYGQTELVVCSRIKDYKKLSTRLKFNGAIFIRALTRTQVGEYLNQAGENLAGVKLALQTDPVIAELAKTPLFLWVMSLAYQGLSIEELPRLTLKEQRRHLFNKYISRMFEQRGGGKYSLKQTIHWLSFLGKQMIQESQTIFLIEWIQPDSLSMYAKKWRYDLGFTLAFGLIGGLILGLFLGFLSELLTQIKEITGGFLNGFLLGVIIGYSISFMGWVIMLPSVDKILTKLIGNKSSGTQSFPAVRINTLRKKPDNKPYEIEIVERLNFIFFDWLQGNGIRTESEKETIGMVKSQLVIGLTLVALGLITKLGGANIVPLNSDELITLGLSVLIFALLFAGISGGIVEASELHAKNCPNQGILKSAINSFIAGMMCCLVFSGLFFLLISLLKYGLSGRLIGVLIGLFLGFLSWFFYGGDACLKHLILRLILYFEQLIPWNYARFLDFCCDRLFLQRVGGGYIFVHRLLMEHFAQIQIER
ncbi:MAG: NACHT domain-containing protein [Oculatellaceae cyanobacterium bins.114]|nr:NACHT domain-containing protein [Oculatellaceae cyanobacterium bins.114]